MNYLTLFPNSMSGGHEQMATRHFIGDPSLKRKKNFLCRNDCKNIFLFAFYLIVSRKSFSNVILISGSPFGHIFLKIFIKLLCYKLIEYTPFPELTEMKDRWHHGLVAHLNYHIIDIRILIDDWQLPYSHVKTNFVIENYV